ncbi:fasciclin domain-containing protein [Robiginitalea sediminis]|uniref:fasciclin domain-containing protein n=1 Tax=Robiginitalea sediminis TaxID=1982593 RepID=UPI000B4B5ED8|nr:fasciclin domain-containing protein [Robiginitalea sediminis]
MKMIKSTLALVMATSLTVACAQDKKQGPSQSDMAENTEASASTWESEPTIVGVASNNAQFSTLVAAVGAADLAGTLNSAGPFTVFAPTNEAFEKLPAGTVETLLKAENKSTLTQILTYHVVAGKFMAKDVIEAIKANNNAYPVETVEGSVLTLSLKDGMVILTDAKGQTSTVTTADVAASNGVIHVIDTVVMPE